MRGGGILIIGVVRALVAILNFAFFVRELLVESCINSEVSQRFDVKLVIARPQLLRCPHLTKTPLCKPLTVPPMVFIVEVYRSLRDGNKISRQ